MRIYLCLLVLMSCCFLVVEPVPAREDGGRTAHDLGVFALEEGDLESAAVYFRAALTAEPGNISYNHLLGRTYLAMDRLSEALPPLIKAYRPGRATGAIQFDLAMARYKSADFQTAAELFADLADRDPNHPWAHYYSGLSHYRAGDFQKAAEYFEQAAEAEPALEDNSSYFAGLSLYRLGERAPAVAKLSRVQRRAGDQGLRSSAAQWLTMIQAEADNQGPIRLYGRIGLRFDDNVRLEPLDEDMFTDEGDVAGVVVLSGRYDFLRRPTLQAGVGYNHYQTLQADLGDFDLTGSLLSLYLQKEQGPLAYALHLLPAYYWLDSASFLRRLQVRPEIVWRLNPRHEFTVSYSYSDEHYFQNGDREGSRNQVALGFLTRFLDGRATFNADLSHERKAAFHPDQDFSQFTAGLGWSQAVAWRLVLDFAGSYRVKSYDNTDSLAGLTREDDRIGLRIGVSRPIWRDNLSLGADFQYIDNDSTIDIFSYRKNVFQVFLSAAY